MNAPHQEQAQSFSPKRSKLFINRLKAFLDNVDNVDIVGIVETVEIVDIVD